MLGAVRKLDSFGANTLGAGGLEIAEADVAAFGTEKFEFRVCES
jgi:hypothetical protein